MSESVADEFTSPTRRGSVGGFIFYLLFVALFIVMGVVFLFDFVFANLSPGWPTTQGKIVDFQLLEVKDKKTNRIHYRCKLKYSYSVDGREYTGERLNGSDNNIVADAQVTDLVTGRLYRPGQQYPVYYWSSRPGVAVLEPGGVWAESRGLFLPGIALVMGVAFSYFAWNHRRLKPNPYYRPHQDPSSADPMSSSSQEVM